MADVMGTDAACVGPELSLVEAVAVMRHKRVPSLFVVDGENTLLGHLTIERIRTAGLPEEATVEQAGVQEIHPVTAEQSAKEVFDRMETQHLDALPVVDQRQTVVGVVTRSSMVRSLANVVWRDQP